MKVRPVSLISVEVGSCLTLPFVVPLTSDEQNVRNQVSEVK